MPDVGCAGLLVNDTFCGPMMALPIEGALMVLDNMPVTAGGCATNVAVDLAKQGVTVDVMGCVGDDADANVLFTTFKANHVGTSKIVRMGSAATSKTVILLIAGQDRRYLHVAGANKLFTTEHISRDWLASLKVFYLGGLFALPGLDMEKLSALLHFCQERGVITVVDVVVSQKYLGMDQLRKLLPLIDVFVPNADEARAFTGLTDPFDQLRSLQNAGANTVIITCGDKGAVAGKANRMWSCGTYQMNVVDPSGSGDAFTSGVIRSMLAGWEMQHLLRYASAIGASATRSAGTTDAVFTAEEAEAFTQANPLTVIDERQRHRVR